MMGEKNKIEIVYCTKYALTQGILLVSGSVELNGEGFMRRDNGMSQYLGRNEWSRNSEEAVRLATAMRDRKIKSIEKQLDKLLQMGFELPDGHPTFNVRGTMTGRLPG